MKQAGFTLIEIMITLTIVSIITAIAVPQYSEYRNKEIRTDAVRSMLKLKLELERCRSRNGDGTFTNCPNTQAAINSLQQHYSITVALNGTNTKYTMTAAKVGKPDTDCPTLTLTHDGLRDASTSNSNLSTVKKRLQRCWSR